MRRVFVVGGASFNLVIHMDELPPPKATTVFANSYYEGPGATGVGKALNLARLGFDVTFHTLLGDDPEGATIRQVLEAEQGLTLLTDVDTAGTEKHVNLMSPDGGRLSVYIRAASTEPALDYARLEQQIQQADVVALNIINYTRRLIPALKAVPCWVDLHNYDGVNPYHADYIEAANVLFFSSDGMRHWSEFMAAQVQAGKDFVVCTHGAEGATALTAAGDWIDVPAVPVPHVVDTNGAGDAFFAGTLAGLRDGLSLPAALHMAAKTAARCVQVQGVSIAHPRTEL